MNMLFCSPSPPPSSMLLLQNVPRFTTIVFDGVSQVFLSEQPLLGILDISHGESSVVSTGSSSHDDNEDENDKMLGHHAISKSDCCFHLLTVTPSQLRQQPQSEYSNNNNDSTPCSSHNTTITTGLIFWSSSQTPNKNASTTSHSVSSSGHGHKRRVISQNDENDNDDKDNIIDDDDDDDDGTDMELEDNNHHSNKRRIRFQNMSRSSSKNNGNGNDNDLSRDDTTVVVEVIAREYDILTEELSSKDIYDRCEQNGLLQSIRLRNNPQIMSCLCEYQTFMNHDQTQAEPLPSQPQPQPLTKRSSSSTTKTWYYLTNYISSTLLVKRGLYRGCKIVPSSYEEEEGKDLDSKHPPTHQEDGITVNYPPVPCIDDTTNSIPTMSTIRSHLGTRQFLQKFYPSPNVLTNLFLSISKDTLPTKIFQKVLKEYYTDTTLDNLLGDIQLSYILFLHLKCYKSFEHWRDLLSMISFVNVSLFTVRTTTTTTMQTRSNSSDDNNDNFLSLDEFILFLTHLLRLLTHQIDTMKGDEFLQDMELYSNNFVIAVIERFVKVANDCLLMMGQGRSSTNLEQSLQQLIVIANKTFQLDLNADTISSASKNSSPQQSLPEKEQQHKQPRAEEKTVCVKNDETSRSHGDYNQSTIKSNQKTMIVHSDDDEDDDEEDDDGPVIVAMEDIEDSLQRINEKQKGDASPLLADDHTTMLKQKDNYHQYPLLMASMASTNGTEDLFMTCARVLDQQNDVSLVREAASFLEDYEKRKF